MTSLDSSKLGNRTTSGKNRTPLATRVVAAAEAALAAEGHVSPMEVLLGIGWLDRSTVERWRWGQIDCLDIQTKPSRIPEALKLFSSWAERRGLSASPTEYVARTPQRQALRCLSTHDVEHLERYEAVISPAMGVPMGGQSKERVAKARSGLDRQAKSNGSSSTCSRAPPALDSRVPEAMRADYGPCDGWSCARAGLLRAGGVSAAKLNRRKLQAGEYSIRPARLRGRSMSWNAGHEDARLASFEPAFRRLQLPDRVTGQFTVNVHSCRGRTRPVRRKS